MITNCDTEVFGKCALDLGQMWTNGSREHSASIFSGDISFTQDNVLIYGNKLRYISQAYDIHTSSHEKPKSSIV
jgi:hypothetical protein